MNRVLSPALIKAASAQGQRSIRAMAENSAMCYWVSR